MDVLKNYVIGLEALFAHVGEIPEDWSGFPIVDMSDQYWGIAYDTIYWAVDKHNVENESGEYYAEDVYRSGARSDGRQCVFRGEDYTMIAVGSWNDLQLMVFATQREVKDFLD